MTYSEFSVEDFVLDKDFRCWVLFPDAQGNLFWHSWLKNNPEKRHVVEEARAIILHLPQINYGWNNDLEDSLWQSIVKDTQGRQTDSPLAKIEQKSAKVVPLHLTTVPNKSDQSGHRCWYKQTPARIAACIVLFTTLSLPAYFLFRETRNKPLTVTHTVEALKGKKENIVLPDGSKLTLNSGSTAHFPDHFDESERLIEISGEAFIEVAKDSLSPFRVKTGVITTEALGTSFNVHYEDERLEISLVEGKVKVSLQNGLEKHHIILTPGEQASLENENYLTKNRFNVEKIIAWKDGVIFFEGAGQEEIIERLERWYGVEITVQGHTSKQWNFTGKFKGKTLEYVLRSLSYTINFRYEVEKDKVRIIYA